MASPGNRQMFSKIGYLEIGVPHEPAEMSVTHSAMLFFPHSFIYLLMHALRLFI